MKLFLAFAVVLLATTVSAQTYRIDPARSTITYSMDHPAHKWSGTSHRVSGTLVVEGGRVVRGQASAPVTSFDSGNRSRDSNMASDTEAYIYPNVTFQAASVSAPSNGRATVRGTLTFHGVARTVSVPVQVSVSDQQVRLQGEFDVTLTEFGIERPSLMMVRTRDWIGLSFEFVAARR